MNDMYKKVFDTLLVSYSCEYIDDSDVVSGWSRLLTESGYNVNEHADQILQSIGGVRIVGKAKETALFLTELYFNPLFYCDSFSEVDLLHEPYVNESVCPIGGFNDATIYVGKSGRYYITDGPRLVDGGSSFLECISIIYNGIYTGRLIFDYYKSSKGAIEKKRFDEYLELKEKNISNNID